MVIYLRGLTMSGLLLVLVGGTGCSEPPVSPADRSRAFRTGRRLSLRSS